MALDLLPRTQHDIYSFSAVASACVNVAEGRIILIWSMTATNPLKPSVRFTIDWAMFGVGSTPSGYKMDLKFEQLMVHGVQLTGLIQP